MTRIRNSRTSAALALSLFVAACGRTGGDGAESGEQSQLPPAAALSAETGLSLESRLERLDADLGAVLDGDLDESSQAALLAAEAITDRLLEEQPGVEWLGTGYYVEARLRQIQALADRIVAELRRDVARELILEDVAALRLAVRDLRERLHATNNGSAPPPLDTLLLASVNDRIGLGGVPAGSSGTASDSASGTVPAAEAEPVAAPEGGPLGEPIRP